MANATPSRLGVINGTTDGSFAQDFALMLKMFAGEIITAFDEKNVMLPLTMVRTIAHGKSAQFPVTWKASAGYHTPGTEILGGQINENEKVINIDAVLLASAFIAKIDEAMNHYDLRSEYAKQLALSLSRQLDKNLLILAILAARASANVTGGNGGTQLVNAGYATTADTLAQGILDAAQKLDEKDVPEDERYCVLSPAKYNLLLTSTKGINRDWNAPSGANGSFAEGVIREVAGVKVIKSNHLPSGVVAAVTGQQNTYSGTFTNTVGVVFHKSAVGTVKLMDLSTENAYDIRRQGTLFVAKYAMGHGILRPEAAVELASA